MFEGLVQDDHPVTLRHILERMRGMYGDAWVVTQLEDGRRRTSYAELARRVDRLSRGLRELGVGPGDRVATFAPNTQEHLELYLAVPCIGAVLHTVNIRLFEEDLEYIFNHAEDRIVFVDATLAERLAPLVSRLPSVQRFVMIGDGADGVLPGAVRYDDLLSAQPDGFDYPDLDDRAAAGLCYTSGTTGRPKGVVYSHRSQMLHSLAQLATDSIAVSSADRVLPVVPMFHANAWGLPYSAGLTGADLLMPSRFTQPEALASMLAEERATIAAAVPTVWLDLLARLGPEVEDLGPLRTVVCGGAAVPLSLMRAFEERFGVRIIQAWGMTETGPLASLARPARRGAAPADGDDDGSWRDRDTAGRILPFVEARVVGEDAEVLPRDGESDGELEVRGPWIAAGYLDDTAPEKFDGGWLRTGDIASIDERGFIRITDRAKDVIKSGGEWISSVELEKELAAFPDVVEAAVIAKPDDRWTERPLACVVLRDGATCCADDLRAHLAERVAKWWLPDAFAFIDEVPKTGTGKYDKKLLRARLAEGRLTMQPAGGA